MPIILALLIALLPSALDAQRAPCRADVTLFDGASTAWQRVARLTGGQPAEVDGVLRTPLHCRVGTSKALDKSVRLVLPDARGVLAGGVPDSRSDGALWAGRGASVLLRTGFTADFGRIHAVLVPEIWYSTNLPFDILPGRDASRSTFASPFYFGQHTLDLPSRPGIEPSLELTPGQSAAWVGLGKAELGGSTSNLWWGPGVRDALLFGPGAAGIPRLFVRTASPVATPLGYLGSEIFIGMLTESRWFNATPQDDHRALSAGALTWSPTRSGELTLGLARATQRVVPRGSSLGVRALDFLQPVSDSQGDRLFAMFGRLSLPRTRMRAYVEVATPRPIGRIRNWLTVPGDGLAYQFGVEKIITRSDVQWILHTEMMNLDLGTQVREHPPRDFYAGYGTPHGWTQRGQLLGAGIGPGGQSQWLSADRVGKRWALGVYGERVRWNNEALLRQYLPTYYRHDVTLRTGIRGSLRTSLVGRPYDVAVDASWGKRLNYLFQNTTFIDYRTVDVAVPQLRLTLSPRQ